jgi:hypothetical protein
MWGGRLHDGCQEQLKRRHWSDVAAASSWHAVWICIAAATADGQGWSSAVARSYHTQPEAVSALVMSHNMQSTILVSATSAWLYVVLA